MMATETPCTLNYSHTKKKDLDEEFKRSDFSVEKSRDDENAVYEMTPSSTRKRQRRIIDSDDEDGIDRKTSIAVVGSDSVENDETTSSEMVRSSSKKKSRVVYRSDSEDDGEDTPGFNALKGRATAVRRFKKNLNEAFGKNEVEDDYGQSTDSSYPEGDGSISESDSSFVGEIGGTSKKRRSARNYSTSGNVLSMEYSRTASVEKMKKKKALEALRKRRERRAGELLSGKSSLDNNYDNEGSVSPKLEENQEEEDDQGEEEGQGEEEDDEEEESGSDMSEFIVKDSQSQELGAISFHKASQKECYKRYIQMMVSSVLDSEFLSSLTEEKVPYFDEAKAAIEGIIETKKNAIKGKWKRFKDMLEYCPFIESRRLRKIIKRTTCEACQLRRNVKEIVVFYGEDNGEKVTPPVKKFRVGCFCAERAHIYHELHHHDFELKKSCNEKINKVKEDNPRIESNEIVEYCINDKEWLKDLYKQFKRLLGLADEYDEGGKKRQHMENYCSSFRN